jgi:hypothetical protein
MNCDGARVQSWRRAAIAPLIYAQVGGPLALFELVSGAFCLVGVQEAATKLSAAHVVDLAQHLSPALAAHTCF